MFCQDGRELVRPIRGCLSIAFVRLGVCLWLGFLGTFWMLDIFCFIIHPAAAIWHLDSLFSALIRTISSVATDSVA